MSVPLPQFGSPYGGNDPTKGLYTPISPVSGQPVTGQDNLTPGGAYAWSDSVLQIGPYSTGIHTRVLKDIAVVILAMVLAVIGFLLMAKPDITSALRTAAKILPEAAA